MPCQYFNQGTCSHSKSHGTRGVSYNHVCSACFSNGRTFPHAEADCKNKLKSTWIKTRVDVGTHWPSNPPHFERFVFSKIVKMARMRHRPLHNWLCHGFRGTKVALQPSLTNLMHRFLKIRYLVRNPVSIGIR